MSDSRLRNYALTAGSAAALAATGLAGADIQTSSGSTPIPEGYGPAGATELFTISGVDFGASNQHYGSWSGAGFAVVSFWADGADGAAADLAFAGVSAGESIGAGFSGGSNLYYYMRFASGQMSIQYGALEFGAGELVGFSVSSSGDTYYGWIEYDLSMSEGSFTFTVNSWAYNDVAGQGIIAGQNQAAGSSAVPGLGGLAALAIGAAGVRTRRQRTVA